MEYARVQQFTSRFIRTDENEPEERGRRPFVDFVVGSAKTPAVAALQEAPAATAAPAARINSPGAQPLLEAERSQRKPRKSQVC